MTDAANLFSFSFALLIAAVVLTKFWLVYRQARCVAANKGRVPPPFASTVDLAAHQKAADYTQAKLRLDTVDTAVHFAVLLGWTLLGGLNALNQGISDLPLSNLALQLVVLVAFVAVGAVLDLPLSWYRTFVLEQRFGFNNSTVAQWLVDGLKGAVLALILGVPLAAAVLWVMRSSGPLWWLWAWMVYMGFSLLLMWAFPAFIAPMFNSFKPLTDATLKDRVSALMVRCGFQPAGFFVMDGSRRSAHANAYFTGMGTHKRVVFYDTLLEQLSPAELEAVLAHELGHFHHRHLIKRLTAMCLVSLGAFAALGWLASRTWFYEGLGVQPSIQTPNDALALILFMLITPLVSFFASPLMAAASRRDEFEADHFAAQNTQAADLASALLKLYHGNASTLTPDPAYVAFFHSHPPASKRLARLTP